MTYAERASSYFTKEQLEHKDIKYLSPPIVKLLFFHVYQEQLLNFLSEKHKSKQELRRQQLEHSHKTLGEKSSQQPKTASQILRSGSVNLHTLFNLDSIMKFDGIRASLKFKPLYKIFSDYKTHIGLGTYNRFLQFKISSSNDLTDTQGLNKKTIFKRPVDNITNKIKLQEKKDVENLRLKFQNQKHKFKSNVYKKIEIESSSEYKEFRLSIEKSHLVVLVLCALEYFESRPDEFEKYNNYE